MGDYVKSERPTALLAERSSHAWRLLRVGSRREKSVSRLLAVKRIVHFVPYASQWRNYAEVNVNVEAPLFPGYVFIHGTEEDARNALDSEGVIGLVSAESEEQLQRELSVLFMAVRYQSPLASSPAAEVTRAEMF